MLDRMRKGAHASRLYWRRLLAGFVQEEVNDYSFLPPDRRLSDSGLFLPDFNQRDCRVKDLLFMVDCSGSVDDELLGAVYSEICAAIEQFGGLLQGKLAFFDTRVTPPTDFDSAATLMKIKARGGGGTDFGCVFTFLRQSCPEPPACLIIFTDGLGAYPAEEEAMGLPVLWLIHGEAPLPPWGLSARMEK